MENQAAAGERQFAGNRGIFTHGPLEGLGKLGRGGDAEALRGSVVTEVDVIFVAGPETAQNGLVSELEEQDTVLGLAVAHEEVACQAEGRKKLWAHLRIYFLKITNPTCFIFLATVENP